VYGGCTQVSDSYPPPLRFQSTIALQKGNATEAASASQFHSWKPAALSVFAQHVVHSDVSQVLSRGFHIICKASCDICIKQMCTMQCKAAHCVLGLVVMKSSTELFLTSNKAISHSTDSECACLAPAMCWSAHCDLQWA